jgi:ketosteroid isomerase-like protein
MLRHRIAFAIVSLGILSAHAQSTDQLYTATRQQLEVTKILLAQQTAWNKGDLDGYLSYYKDAPDTQAIIEGPVRGLQKIRSAYRTNYPSGDSMGELEQSEIDVRSLGDNFALATGRYTLSRHRKPDVQGGFTEVLERTGNGWRVIYSETS